MLLDDFLLEIEGKLPEMSTTKDLIELGLFASKYDAIRKRQEGKGPEFIKLSVHRICYPKKSVMSWLRKRVEISKKKQKKKEIKDDCRTTKR